MTDGFKDTYNWFNDFVKIVQHTKNLCTIWTKILVGFYADFFSGYTGVFRLLRKNDYF